MRVTRTWNAGILVRSTLAALVALAAPTMAQAQQGTISGRVTAAAGEPLAESRVMLAGTSTIVSTTQDGKYTLRNVPLGKVVVRVIRVGFVEQKKSVDVASGNVLTLDFTMVPAVVQLQEIVTTATGEQRRVEIGNSISTLGDVNKRVEESPVTNLSDLMVAKSPGVIILPGNMTSSAPTVRIRGLNSMSLTNAPIYVIDGVRMNSGSIAGGVGGTNTSYINDLNPAEIEDIEIVKGPSAATLYGTDAANGVIVITTKKGKAGSSRWTWYGEQGTVQDRNNYPSSYALWGHTAANPTAANPVRCNLVTVGQGTCIVDSTTSANMFEESNSGIGMLATVPHSQFGGQVSGGNDALRFFISSDITNELGPVKMPGAFISRFDSIKVAQALQIGVRDEWVRPEMFQRANVRTNINAAISPKLDMSINAGFGKTDQRLPNVDNNTFSYLYNSYQNPGFIPERIGESAVKCNANPAKCLGYSDTDGNGYDLHGYGLYSPGELFQRVVSQDIQRFIGSAQANWRPLAWMQNDATVGMDLADRENLIFNRLNEGPASGTTRDGTVTDSHNNDRNFSAKITSNSTWQAKQYLNFKTSLGADYVNVETDGASASGTGLPPGGQNVGQTATRSTGNTNNQLPQANKTLGVYIQELASIRDRLFLTAAVRSDQNSAFGTNFQRVFYPKASASYIISDESFFPKFNALDQLRLRFAYGASGVQPGATTTFRTYQASTANVATPGSTAGTDKSGLIANALGNADLKPEKSTEAEMGFEARLFTNRINFDLTYYNKKTQDALVNKPIAPSSGASATSVLTNLASVQNNGIEAVLTTTIFDRRNFGWDVTLSGSHGSNKILKVFGPNGYCSSTITTACDSVGTGTTRNIKGKPVNGEFYVPFTYADSNSDGIITPNEVIVGTRKADGTLDQTTVQYRGYSNPRDIVSIQSGFDLFQHKLRITGLFDYKGGFDLFNSTSQFYCQQTNFCYDVSIGPGSKVGAPATLFNQARNVAQRFVTGTKTQVGYLESGQFWRFRELAATIQMPNAIAAKLRARDANINISGRNLHVWTPYKGIDPESGYGNNDIQNDFSTTSPPTYFTVRLNLHY
ncbi:MAG: SusC/RagA family TonB-linked outer membrane protein [bacterium]